MKKTAIAIILAACVSAAVLAEEKPANPAAFTIGLMSESASKSTENSEIMTRGDLQDAMHKRCLNTRLKDSASVARASAFCQEYIADLTKPRDLSVLDFMWLLGTLEIMTSSEATKEEKTRANHGLVKFIARDR